MTPRIKKIVKIEKKTRPFSLNEIVVENWPPYKVFNDAYINGIAKNKHKNQKIITKKPNHQKSQN